MKKVIGVAALVAVAACSGAADETDASTATSDATEAEVAVNSSAVDRPQADIVLPFDLPISPESRISDGVNEYDFQGTPMAQFRMDSKLPSAEVFTFYTEALEERGFDVSITSQDEDGGILNASRADGAQLSIHSINSGSTVEEGESGSTFTATLVAAE